MSGHEHAHNHGPSGTGTVVLDLGGDTGALIIYTGRQLLGREIEVSRADRDGDPRTHSAVRERRVRDGTFHSAVYPDLPAGVYTVWWDAETPVGAVTVSGGVVTEFALPTSLHPLAD
ncbi:phospholipase [Verrucosispora sioxanthis]|uniref:Phospholipase n=1 Tax=Verrucosispora sioxanthis TaxID=2499994 RepID=A0A6M1L707_9ACTN|nr:phospholipase [Verrucosispora sioxanthis]NEE63023.1 phospholipase [Verrucosispora sioxanthis]NGM12133.1 phospholipase [Verrucosispora sioxanthis]